MNTGMRLTQKDKDITPVFIYPNDIDKDDFDGLHIVAKILLCKRKVSGRPKPVSFWK
mgnify:CR=1 FL=1